MGLPYKPGVQGNGEKVSLYPLGRFVRAAWSPASGGAPRKLPVGLMDVCLSLATHQLSHLPLLTVGCSLLSMKPSISPCSCLRPPGALWVALPLIHLGAITSFIFSSPFLHSCPTPAACFIPLSQSSHAAVSKVKYIKKTLEVNPNINIFQNIPV